MGTMKKDFSGKCLGRPSFQATGQIFFRILPIRMNCLHSLHPRFKYLLALQTNLCITAGDSAVNICSSSSMPNCNHEEADMRIVVHILHALNQNCRHRYYNSYSLVGVLSELHVIQTLVDDKFRFCSINTSCDTLGPKSRVLPELHALTGCDISLQR